MTRRILTGSHLVVLAALCTIGSRTCYAASPGDTLHTNQVLHVGDYLVSQNGAFICLMQGDGNLVVYRAHSPEDVSHGSLWADGNVQPNGNYLTIMQADGNLVVYQGSDFAHHAAAIWNSNTSATPSGGNYFLIMQNDGNLVVYQGHSVSDRGAVVWNSTITDPVTGFENVSAISYQLDKAKILSVKPLEIFHQGVDNTFDTAQTSNISGSESVSEEKNWSDSITNTVGGKNTLSVGLEYPVLKLKDDVELSYQHATTSMTGGSTTDTYEWTFQANVSMPPHSKGDVSVIVQVGQLSVPYSLAGSVVYTSGTRMPINAQGLFTGTNSYDMEVQYSGEAKDTPELKKMLMEKQRIVFKHP